MFQPKFLPQTGIGLPRERNKRKKNKQKRPKQVRKQGFYSYSKRFPQCVQSDRILYTKATEECREVGQFLQRLALFMLEGS